MTPAKVRAGLTLHEREDGYWVAHDPVTAESWRLTTPSALLVQAVAAGWEDGSPVPATLVGLVGEDRSLLLVAIQDLIAEGVLTPAEEVGEPGTSASLRSGGEFAPRWADLRFATGRIPVLPKFLREPVARASMLLPAVATVALIWTAWLWTNRTGSIVVTLLSRLPAIPTGKLFGLVVLSSLAMKLVHELGHAVVMGAVSGRSTVVGLRLAFGVPQAYADVSALATVRLRGRRLAVLFAGVSAETLAWAVVAILVLRDVRGASTIALVTVLISGPASVVFNLALPFLRNDGYFVMEELSGIANLSTKALASARMEFGAPSLATARAEPWWLAWYGALDLAYGAVASGLLPALLLQVAGVPTSLSAALGLIVGVTLSWKRMQAAVKSLGARSL